MTSLNSRIFTLFVAKTFSFLVAGIAFIAYSRLLSPQEFGLYAIAFSIASIATQVLDGGLKTTIIKLERELEPQEEAQALHWMLILFLCLFACSLPFYWVAREYVTAFQADLGFAAVYIGGALLAYPFIMLPTARLERRLEYAKLGWVEAGAMLIERALPALLLVLGLGIYAFVWALFAGRVFSLVVLLSLQPITLVAPFRRPGQSILPLVKEGTWLQAGALSSMVRDNLHTLIVGPWFGKAWVGYYAWAHQLSLISSQLFVGIAARVSLPIFASCTSFEERWSKCRKQIRLLAMLTAPILCGIWYVMPSLNEHFFRGEWEPALALLPLVFARMIPGVATSSLSSLVIVERGGKAFAKVSLFWTTLEAIAAVMLLILLGPVGLAWSQALLVWAGLSIMVSEVQDRRFTLPSIGMEILCRPSLLFATVSITVLSVLGRLTPFWNAGWMMTAMVSLLVILSSYSTERELRDLFRAGRQE